MIRCCGTCKHCMKRTEDGTCLILKDEVMLDNDCRRYERG